MLLVWLTVKNEKKRKLFAVVQFIFVYAYILEKKLYLLRRIVAYNGQSRLKCMGL